MWFSRGFIANLCYDSGRRLANAVGIIHGVDYNRARPGTGVDQMICWGGMWVFIDKIVCSAQTLETNCSITIQVFKTKFTNLTEKSKRNVCSV